LIKLVTLFTVNISNNRTQIWQNHLRRIFKPIHRHERMILPILPILQHYQNTKWLTVGDGRFGGDSLILNKLENSLNVLPSDISPYLLEYSKNQGKLKNFAIENAEQLSFEDNSFDFGFCKEAYHHFPRPYLALYEMLRVARKGIILIEPNGQKNWAGRLLRAWKRRRNRLSGIPSSHSDSHLYETVGNYVYTITEREMEKLALGLNFPMVAFYYLNDFYESAFVKANLSSKSFQRFQQKIRMEDFLCRLGIKSHGLVIAVIFKQTPDNELITKLQKAKFKVFQLPRNPYL